MQVFALNRFLVIGMVAASVAMPARSQELPMDVQHGWLPSALSENCVRRTVACVAVDNTVGDVRDNDMLRRRNLGIIIGSAAAVGLYGKQKWWQDGFNSRLSTANEGWFGQNTYNGGADKLGHFFMNYAGTRLMNKAFVWAGNDPETSLAFAAWSTLGIFTAVEVLDGFSRRWHFSKEDALINAAGTGAALLFERNPALDRLFDIRLLYVPSRENGRQFSPFGDNSGQTYLLVTKASGIDALRSHSVLRYFELAVGYRARGYTSEAGRLVEAGTRDVYVGVSLNVAELLGQTVFRHSGGQSRAQAFGNTALEYLQIPGTAVMGSHSLGRR
jgi:hypothetical protein